MSGKTITRPDESEAETFCELSYRFMSAAYRLRLAVNDIERSEAGLSPAALFVLQEAADDLEKINEDLRAWENTHEHELREIEHGRTPKMVQS